MRTCHRSVRPVGLGMAWEGRGRTGAGARYTCTLTERALALGSKLIL